MAAACADVTVTPRRRGRRRLARSIARRSGRDAGVDKVLEHQAAGVAPAPAVSAGARQPRQHPCRRGHREAGRAEVTEQAAELGGQVGAAASDQSRMPVITSELRVDEDVLGAEVVVGPRQGVRSRAGRRGRGEEAGDRRPFARPTGGGRHVANGGVVGQPRREAVVDRDRPHSGLAGAERGEDRADLLRPGGRALGRRALEGDEGVERRAGYAPVGDEPHRASSDDGVGDQVAERARTRRRMTATSGGLGVAGSSASPSMAPRTIHGEAVGARRSATPRGPSRRLRASRRARADQAGGEPTASSASTMDGPYRRARIGAAMADQELKAGSRWQSVVDDTQVIVVKAPNAAVELQCGGHPMVPVGGEVPERPVDRSGVRRTDRHREALPRRGDGIELLATKGGAGTLALDGTAIPLKDAKPLPASN